MEMEAGKRKRSENDVGEAVPKKPRDPDPATAGPPPPSPPEEEVEEFFAILRRMRDAMAALSRSGADVPRSAEKWTVAIDTGEAVKGVTGVLEDEASGKEELFDLNVTPEPETTTGS